jgi:hypothetical protein
VAFIEERSTVYWSQYHFEFPDRRPVVPRLREPCGAHPSRNGGGFFRMAILLVFTPGDYFSRTWMPLGKFW